MGKINRHLIEETKKYFREKKIFTVDQLTGSLKCSTISARRRLKEWNTFTSYNQKGRYYTLPDVPTFDIHGLWFHENAFFTKHGNLKRTIVCLLKNSSTGMSSHEIGNIVRLNPGSFMHHFRDIPGTRRERHKGRFIYFSDIPEIYQRQKSNLRLAVSKRLLSDADAVLILVQLIKNPGISIEELSNKVTSQGIRIEPTVIKCFLEHYDLLEKKTDTKQ